MINYIIKMWKQKSKEKIFNNIYTSSELFTFEFLLDRPIILSRELAFLQNYYRIVMKI